MYGERDLPIFFADFGDEITFAGGTPVDPDRPVKGNLDQPEMVQGGVGGFDTTLPTLRLPYNAFDPMPAALDQIQVGDATYSVSEVTAESDGAVLVYLLKGPLA